MTREEIIDLIREECDPKPKHWHDTDRWDDGVGGIADKILSLLTVSEKRAGTAEQLAEDWQCEYDKVIDERDSLRSSLMRVVEIACQAVCRHCREGIPVIKDEWHEIKLTDPDERAKVYCLGFPIRSALQASGDG